MKILLPSDSSQVLGGAWTFRRNLEKGMKSLGHQIVNNPDEADIALIAGTTMVTKETMQLLKDKGLKIVVRLDNVPRNSRNRNTGTSRMKSFCDMADEVIWQCGWAKFYLEDFINKEGIIIYNGVDTDIFNPNGESIDFGVNRNNTYLYSRYNRDETKNWEVAWYKFQLIARQNKDAKLVIVGRFSPEQEEYNFDFFRGEKIEYRGVVEDSEMMARIMRGCGYILATYYNDAFSNTYLEALACGCELYEPDLSGGTSEMLNLYSTRGIEYFTLERMAKEYEDVFNKVLSK